MNVFEKVVALLLSIFLVFGFSLVVTTDNNDYVSRNIVEQQTIKFVNNVRNNGYISGQEYNEFMQTILLTNNLYDISMTVEHTKYDPVYDNDGNFTGDYQVNCTKIYEDEILDVIAYGNDYELSAGDYFYVTVKSTTPTMGGRIRALLLRIGSESTKIVIHQGGVVRNELD